MDGRQRATTWWLAVSAALMVIAAVAPWERVQVVSRNGIDDGDGWIVVAAAALAGAMLALYRARGARTALLVSAFCGVLGLVVFFVNADGILWNEAINEILGRDVVSPRWGFFLLAGASASLVLASLAFYALAEVRAARSDQATSTAQSP